MICLFVCVNSNLSKSEQISTIKDTHTVLKSVNEHLTRTTDTNSLPSPDQIEDLQDALSVSHSVFEEINDVLKES